METTIKDFDAMKIKNVSVQYKDETPNAKFGCMGSISGETKMRTVTKKCEGVAIKTRSFPISHSLTLAGYVPVSVLRDTFGIKNTGLKPGVYSYGTDSKGKEFVLTADVIDEFEDVTKLVAFPNANSATGLKYSIDNDADEVAYVELEFNSNPDEEGQFYYEAFVKEIDEAIKTGWHTDFKRELIAMPEA